MCDKLEVGNLDPCSLVTVAVGVVTLVTPPCLRIFCVCASCFSVVLFVKGISERFELVLHYLSQNIDAFLVHFLITIPKCHRDALLAVL